MIEPGIRQGRILIVDDQVCNVSLLENMLGRIGYTNLRSITDSRETLAQVGQFQPDLILLDINMPYLDGFAVLKQLAVILPPETYLPVLVLTADATKVTKRKALASGAADFLQKPFDASEIFMRIRNLLEARFLHVQMDKQIAERTRELQAALADLKASQQQVVRQERLHAFAEMAGGVVHDFNNALMSVIGYSELMLQDPSMLDDRATALDYLGTINTAGRDASHVISRLRDFYRPREDSDVFTAVDLNAVIVQALAITQPKWRDQALASGCTVEVIFDPGKIPPVTAIAAELREVLTNLIFNAVDAMPQGGTLTLRTQRDGSIVLLELTDTGIGMSDEVRDRCLEPFYSTKGEKGTGLGLSMVFGILKRHKGTLEVQSELGKGSTFLIGLPSEIKTFEPKNRDESHVSPLHVLVVDDEPVARDVVSKYLSADGHHVVTAMSGHEALKYFKSHRFDLLITDHGMPGMNGLQLASQIRRMQPDQPIILLSGFSDSKFDTDDLPAFVDLRLTKPIPHDAAPGSCESSLLRAVVAFAPGAGGPVHAMRQPLPNGNLHTRAVVSHRFHYSVPEHH